MTHQSYAAYGTLLKRGDGGVGSAVKATKTFGTLTSGIVFTAVLPGTAGNSITVTITASGSAVAAATVVGRAITVNVAATTGTVNDAIMAIYQSAAARALVDAAPVSTGVGVLSAASVQSLAGGTAGTEAFTTIDGVKDLSGPSFSAETIDVTHQTSGSAYKEKLPSFMDGGEISFDLLYDPASTVHEGILTDFEGRTKRNWQMVLTDASNKTSQFAAYVTGAALSAPMNDAVKIAVKLTIAGAVDRDIAA